MTPKQKLDHYRTYMKIYGSMIMYLADHEKEVIKIIDGDSQGPLLDSLRDRIKNSPFFEQGF